MSMFAGGQYRPLTQDAIEAIHNGSMHIFEKVGVEVHSQRALEIFKAKGARVDFEDKRVYLGTGGTALNVRAHRFFCAPGVSP
ncbi:MAG: hypothetical protein B1H40_03575 [Candidatus Latescibacteria bacterium 4484_181]|nr:MAG: hypothetical protein B1H40_03575 [Candidatus Latescibacteria bacterium 4484_181]